MTSQLDIAATMKSFFLDVQREVFAGDPVANPNLRVEVLGPWSAGDTEVAILIAPWTISGFAFPPDGSFPESITIGARSFPVFSNTLEELGSYRSVSLVPDVAVLQTQEAARTAAIALAKPFVDTVAAAREATTVPNPSRRKFLTSLGD